MQIKTFPYDNFATENPERTLADSLRALFMGRFFALDTASLSLRHGGKMIYTEGATSAGILLDQKPANDAPDKYRHYHDRIYKRFDDINAVVMASPPEAMTLLEHNQSLGHPTSMMKKRNVFEPDQHVYPSDALEDFDSLLDAARTKTDAADMAHMLMIVRGWGVICCAPNLPEAIAHFQNIELLARLTVATLTMKG